MPVQIQCPECGDWWLGNDGRTAGEEVVCNECWGEQA